MSSNAEQAIDQSVRDLLQRRERLVLAVSGGLDSSVLLDAVGRLRTPAHRVVVATVDHGTGPEATEAVARTVLAASMLGLTAITERLSGIRASEALWREARWAFLRSVARREQAAVVTAHTRDDQVETVVMRILRDAGVRGLAGLLAPSDAERPLLSVQRQEIREYAQRRRVTWVDDPSNESRRFLRNRVRLDLLPAISKVSPRFADDMVRLSERAADLRQRVADAAPYFTKTNRTDGLLVIDTRRLGAMPADSVRLVLPEAVAIAGIRLDRRGLELLVGMIGAGHGVRGQLSGGFEAVRGRDEIVIVRLAKALPDPARLLASGETLFAGFRFSAVQANEPDQPATLTLDAWRMQFPQSMQLIVRQWHPGDRLTNDITGGQRRIVRYFADAGIVGPLRERWPVVVRGKDVVWIPGVRGTPRPTTRGEPMIEYRCERVRE